MVIYNKEPSKIIKIDNVKICSFLDDGDQNIDSKSVKSFGEEWGKFDKFSDHEITQIGRDYFDIVDKTHLDKSTTNALDVGCGSGRWSKYIADKVKFIEAVDPSSAVLVASKMLKDNDNIRVTQASANNLPFPDNSFDFVFSLGVLHHIPDTRLALRSCISKLKSGGYLLIYLYYNLDNRNFVYKSIFYLSAAIRWFISKFSRTSKKVICDIIGYTVYLPISRLAGLAKKIGLPQWKSIPLSYYHDKSLTILRNDALDRFGTPLEQRFSRITIKQMLESEGMTNIVFSEKAPYWHVLSQKS